MILKVIICLCFISITGVFGKKDRILGGTIATINEFPYLASIRRSQLDNQFVCAATIISKWNVLTTAHCIFPIENEINTLKVATGSSSSVDVFGTYKVEKIHYHPFFVRSSPYMMDISVLKLRYSITFNQFQYAIPFPRDPPETGYAALIAGWGIEDSPAGQILTSRLKKAVVYTLNTTDCQDIMPHTILNSQICTYHNMGIGVFSGDAGGPVVVNGELYGIISYSNYHYDRHSIDVHVNVYHHIPFLRDVMHE